MWFAPPKEIPARVLTRVPDRFRRFERSEWADGNRAGAPADCFLEGPCFDDQGRLYVVDIPYGRIFRVDGDAWTLIAEYPGWPNGLKVQPDGILIAADYRHGLVRIDPATGATSAVIQTVLSESFKGLNDLALHDDESILFTDQGQTGLQDPTGRSLPFAQKRPPRPADFHRAQSERTGAEHRADPFVYRDDPVLRGVADCSA